MLTVTPHGVAAIVAAFGSLSDPRFEERNIVSFALPYPLLYAGRKVSRSRCHKALVDNFVFAFERIASKGLQDYARNYSGIYAPRNMRGGLKPSTHSWGIAIDLEAEKFPLRSKKRQHPGVIEAFADAGFFYGGDFVERLDPMHFQFATGY